MPSENTKSPSRIAIVGSGQVGGAAAYALVLGHVADELLLVDKNVELRDGQVRDLTDVAYCHHSMTRVRAASYHEAGQCDMVIIAAGCRYTTGQTTLESTSRNISILRNVVEAMKPFRADSVLLVVANPVDLLTSMARELSGLPESQVLGSGTFLDTVRMRGLLADSARVALDSVHVNVLGVHGDSQVAAWSTATIDGTPIEKKLPSGVDINRAELEAECRNRSRVIIRAKGSTPFGIGSVAANICGAVLHDKRSVHPVSHYQPKFQCCFSLPAILGRGGIVSTMPPHLSSEEEDAIASTAKELWSTADRILGHNR